MVALTVFMFVFDGCVERRRLLGFVDKAVLMLLVFVVFCECVSVLLYAG